MVEARETDNIQEAPESQMAAVGLQDLIEQFSAQKLMRPADNELALTRGLPESEAGARVTKYINDAFVNESPYQQELA